MILELLLPPPFLLPEADADADADELLLPRCIVDAQQAQSSAVVETVFTLSYLEAPLLPSHVHFALITSLLVLIDFQPQSFFLIIEKQFFCFVFYTHCDNFFYSPVMSINVIFCSKFIKMHIFKTFIAFETLRYFSTSLAVHTSAIL